MARVGLRERPAGDGDSAGDGARKPKSGGAGPSRDKRRSGDRDRRASVDRSEEHPTVAAGERPAADGEQGRCGHGDDSEPVPAGGRGRGVGQREGGGGVAGEREGQERGDEVGEMARALEVFRDALVEMQQKGIHGKQCTPFLLSKIAQVTLGESLVSNIQLVLNNARLGAAIASELALVV